MKLTTLLLASSLALNVLMLATGIYRPTKRPDADAAIAGTSPDAQNGAARPDQALTAKALLALEPAALRAELQRLKLPREAIDALVTARIFARHDARRHELMLATGQLPWWQTVTAGVDRMNLLPADQRRELRDLNAAARNDVLRVLGPEALDRDGAIAARYGFISAERAVGVDALIHDYADINAALREEMHGLRTAADREREGLVESERQRDLAKLLSPAEREIFELRTSPAGDPIRYRLATFEPSETEYRAMFAVYRDFDESHPGSVTPDGQTRRAAFSEYPEYEQKIRGVLGDTRYGDWTLTGQSYTAALVRLGPELGLAPTAVKEAAVSLRDTAARSWTISEDATMTTSQRLAALTALVATTRSTFASKFGDAGSVMLARSAPWLEMIENGNAVKIDGNGTSWRPVNRVTAPSRPPTPGK